MPSEQQKLYSMHQSLSKMCKFEDWSVSGQRENGLKEHGNKIIVKKNHLICRILVGSVFRSTIKAVKA